MFTFTGYIYPVTIRKNTSHIKSCCVSAFSHTTCHLYCLIHSCSCSTFYNSWFKHISTYIYIYIILCLHFIRAFFILCVCLCYYNCIPILTLLLSGRKIYSSCNQQYNCVHTVFNSFFMFNKYSFIIHVQSP